jgi:hypothetical protein
MTLSMYQASVPVLERALTNLDSILRKGEDFVKDREIAPEVLLGSRLAVDMFPLSRQVQVVSDTAKGCVCRLAGLEIPAWEDDETSFTELYERINKTITYINSVPAEKLDDTEDNKIEMKLPQRTLEFTGLSYLLGFVLPNTYFHVTTAYNILRHCGVELGKPDYIGPIAG